MFHRIAATAAVLFVSGMAAFAADPDPVRPGQGSPAAPLRLVQVDELNAPGRNIAPWLSPDGLTIYWERTSPGQLAQIWSARRKNARAPFENARQLLAGRCPTVTADGLQMILVRPDSNGQQKWLQVATRTSTDQPFGPARDIPELQPAGNERFGGPCLSADGLQLYFYVWGSEKLGLYMTSRTSGGPWGPLRAIPLADPLDRNLAFPYLIANGLSLFCTHQGPVGQGRIMMWSRKDVDSTFTDYRYVASTEGAPPNRRNAARYVEKTSELFFSAGELGAETLWVVKGFRGDATDVAQKESKPAGSKSSTTKSAQKPDAPARDRGSEPKTATGKANPRIATPAKEPSAMKGQPAAPAQFRAILDQACRQSNLPALAAAVIVDGKLVAADAVGVRKLGTKVPVTADDAFHIGSCAKAMTATVFGLLVDSGKLRWDTTLADAFPQ